MDKEEDEEWTVVGLRSINCFSLDEPKLFSFFANHSFHPEIFNTDQGSQYTSEVHTQRLKKLGITISMDGKGRATDNICIERYWRSAKVERIYLNAYQTINELTTDVDDYSEFYNNRRFHQTLDYKKPMDLYSTACKPSS
jgi:putative transposase